MSITKNLISKYGTLWAADVDPLEIELGAIRLGGRWGNSKGEPCGEGLFHHFMEARALLWPHRCRHRWTDLIYKNVLENQVIVLMGCASSQKSGTMSEMGLIKYWSDPDNTAIYVSSTTREKLEAAIFGEIKMLFREGKLKYPWLAGNPIEYKQCITTDTLDDSSIRDLRKGIIAKACYTGQNSKGLGVFAGLKQGNVWWLCDELQFMEKTFMDAIPNMRSNKDCKIVCSGNPKHDPEDQLGILGEPKGGWGSMEDNEKTAVWPIKLTGGVCVNLIGTDSPNFDHESDIFPKLIGRDFEQTLRADYGANSPKYETQIKGRMKMSLAKSRVITRQLCRDHGAHDKAVWEGTERTKIHACDPAYGGGDRCISGWGEFGKSSSGEWIIRITAPRAVKIDLKRPLSPEDQIAEAVKKDLEDYGIPPAQSFYDSFGKGTVGNAFAKTFGHICPIPIDAGQRPTTRPVRNDLKVDNGSGGKRLKRCDEEYGKFITELWFAARNIIECGQMRELPEDVMAEGCMREYHTVNGNKLDVEPKDEMRARIGKSPDLFDWLCILIEGARRHGFQIGKLGAHIQVQDEEEDCLAREQSRYSTIITSKLLQR